MRSYGVSDDRRFMTDDGSVYLFPSNLLIKALALELEDIGSPQPE